MTIPEDTTAGTVLALPVFMCGECHEVLCVRLDHARHGLARGTCGCGREWYVPLEQKLAHYLTANQVKQREA